MKSLMLPYLDGSVLDSSFAQKVAIRVTWHYGLTVSKLEMGHAPLNWDMVPATRKSVTATQIILYRHRVWTRQTMQVVTGGQKIPLIVLVY